MGSRSIWSRMFPELETQFLGDHFTSLFSTLPMSSGLIKNNTEGRDRKSSSVQGRHVTFSGQG
ncbi:hypothetical protein EAJ17_11675 [Akkermansia sp. aa_0143]|nr:hypothetical protein F2A21_11005 [Akkermansia sp. BIOML-A54]RYT95006.1 hypothetical protein EAJ17_11675 [Akkermansia sp. aa_0143]